MQKLLLSLLTLFSYLLVHSQSLSIQLVGSGFSSPVDIQSCGDNRLFIVEQDGYIRIMSKTGVVNPTPFLNIDPLVNSSGNEQGLLGLAFSPNYKQDGLFFVNYINGSGSGKTRISKFQVSASDSNVANPNSEVILMEYTQPYTNHNGGNMMFGKDGFLYISLGDGGSGGDPGNRAQDLTKPLGKMLRINPLNDSLYTIPSSNPFVNNSTAVKEIWAYGLRNAWRCSVDRITGDIWYGDVGQNVWEEIDFEPYGSAGGVNYGWRCYEGNHAYNTTGCGPMSNYAAPVYEYEHSASLGCSVTGGYVYRGAQYNILWGKYIFGDFCGNKFFTLENVNGVWDADTLNGGLSNQFSTFGQDNLGEIYLGGRVNGNIYRLKENTDCTPVSYVLEDDTVWSCPGSVTLHALEGEALTYQWYKDGQSIAGATGLTYNASSAGEYYVIASKANCANSLSSNRVDVVFYETTPIKILNLPDTLCNVQGVTLEADQAGATFTVNGVAATTIPALSVPGTYTVICNRTDNNGCLSADTATLQVVICPSVNEMDKKLNVSMFPNPAKNQVKIIVQEFNSESLNVQSMDAMGRLVFNKQLVYKNELTIDVSTWSAGVYTLRVSGSNASSNLRLVIEK